MDIKVVANSAGIFAKVILAIQTVKKYCDNKKIRISEINSIYFESVPNGVPNLFDYVLDQEKLDKYDVVLQARKYNTYLRMSNSPDLSFYREIFKKVKFKDSLLDAINPDINENTIGVHIRLTDMNALHKSNYGVRTFNGYLNHIKSVVEKYGDSNIFVSSDNMESIKKLEAKYKIITNTISNRHNSEVDKGNEYNNFLKQNHQTEQFWFDSFLDMISLSRCGYLVKGVSSLSTTSIVVSHTIKEFYYV